MIDSFTCPVKTMRQFKHNGEIWDKQIHMFLILYEMHMNYSLFVLDFN